MGGIHQNAAQISGQNTIHIAFSKLTGSPLSTVNRLKTGSPNLMWTELKKELSMQYSVILLSSVKLLYKEKVLFTKSLFKT